MMFFQRTVRDNAYRSQWLTKERAFSQSWGTDPQMSYSMTDEMWGMFILESVSWRHNFRQSHRSREDMGLDGMRL